MSAETITDYSQRTGLSERTVYKHISDGKVIPVKIDGKTHVLGGNILKFNCEQKGMLVQSKQIEFNERLKSLANYIKSIEGKRDSKVSVGIREILSEINYLRNQGIVIKGFSLRSIQDKIQKCLTNPEVNISERKSRSDKFGARISLLKDNPDVLKRAIELVGKFYIQSASKSLNKAIDRARYYAEQNEDYYEVRAINFYTLKFQINNAFRASGMTNLHDYFNHFNIWRKKLPYVQGSFTYDIKPFDIYCADDRKADVSGAFEWDADSGKLLPKKLYMWTIIDAVTMFPLGWKMQTKPFNQEDLVLLLMRVFKTYGLPNQKIIYDNGLMADDRCIQFFNRLGVAHENQTAYSPTDKAPIERIHLFMKEECDCYNENFVGSNHPVEGRHRGLQLSPEEINALTEEEIKRYENYFAGFYQDRPRLLQMEGIDELRDNTKRVTIRKVFDYFNTTRQKNEVSDKMLRYAYMQQDVVTMNNYYIKFKGNVYIPINLPSYILNNPAYRFVIAFDPADLSYVDIYPAQDIEDRISGAIFEKGKYICTFYNLMQYEPAEKKAKIAEYKRKVKKEVAKLARIANSKMSFTNDLVNLSVDMAGEVYDESRAREKEIKTMIENAVKLDEIEIQVTQTDKPVTDDSFSDEAINEINKIKLDE